MSKKDGILSLKDFGSKASKAAFEKNQESLKKAVKEVDRLEAERRMKAQNSVNSYLANILNQLIQYPAFREYIETNFVVQHGVDKAGEILYVTVNPRNPDLEKQTVDKKTVVSFLENISDQAKDERASGQGSEAEGEQLREDSSKETEGVVEPDQS